MTAPPPNPPNQAAYPAYPHSQPAEGRPVSFYLAIFLAMLLVISAGLNLVLLFVGVVSSAAGSFVSLDEGQYEMVGVGGDAEAADKVLRIPIEGVIAENANPFLGAAGGMVTQVERALRIAGRDDTIRGVILRINSPGGGVTDSERIHRAIEKFKADSGKPVIAHLGDIAASGGYYVAMACDAVFAENTTITGSIGVILSAWNYSELIEKHGVKEVNVVSTRTPYKAMLSGAKPVDEAELAIARSIVDEMYDRFVDVVNDGRTELTRDEVVALADGRIYSAEQARNNRLIDGIGSDADVLLAMSTRTGKPALRLVERRRRPNLLDLFTGAHAESAPDPMAVLGRFLQRTTGAPLYFWPGGR